MDDQSSSDKGWLASYCADIGGWGWAMYVGFFLSAIGLVTTVVGWTGQVPAPLWVGGMVVTALLAPILAYRKMHDNLSKIRSEQRQAYQARDTAIREAGLGDERWQERFSELEIKHKKEMADIGRDLFNLQGELSRTKSDLDSRQAARRLRESLAAFLADGANLLSALKKPEANCAELDAKSLEWVHQVFSYLQTEAPDKSYCVRFVATDGYPRSKVPQSVAVEGIGTYATIAVRLDVLRGLIEEIGT